MLKAQQLNLHKDESKVGWMNASSRTFSSAAGVSNSSMLPESSTMMRSESVIVCSLCAMVSTVHSEKALRIVL